MNRNNLLKISKEDLKSAIVLYENKNYPQALFCFQQAVEKATKYLAMSCGITEDDFRKKIKHDGMKLFKEMYKQIQSQNDFIPIPTVFISELETLQVELKSLSNQDLISFLLRQISSVYETPYPIAIQDMSKPLQLVIDYL